MSTIVKGSISEMIRDCADSTLTVNKKPVTITAKAQEVTYPTAISSTPADITATGLVSGHTASAITLTPSITNAGSGTITPSDATIQSGSTDVTANYNMSDTPCTDTEPTGIADLQAGATANGKVIFDLSGRRVNHVTHGIYIVNGKKVVVQ